MLALQLERLQVIDTQIAKLNGMIAQAMKPHQDAVIRLVEVPGLGVHSAQQVIAEVEGQHICLCSRIHFLGGNLSRKGRKCRREPQQSLCESDKYLRRVLEPGGSRCSEEERQSLSGSVPRLLPRLGYQSAIWAIAHRLCRVVWKILHEGVRFMEQGRELNPKAKQ